MKTVFNFISIIQFIILIASVSGLAPLEKEDGGPIRFGTWWDRLNGQTPVDINRRFGRSLSIFQCDINITSTLQGAAIDEIFKQIKETNTTATVYLTIYPIEGFEVVSDKAIDDLAQKVKNLNDQGTQLFLRYASEMNGAWFYYGQQPTAFKISWKRVVEKIRAIEGPNNVAFIWAPNSQNGYPYSKSTFSNTPEGPKWDPELDTNKDGVYDLNDDPFSPFYPGDDWVDWVGMSMYHYGKAFPWIDNVLPVLGEAESIMIGRGSSKFNFYEMFCGGGTGGQPQQKSTGGKPMIITESGAAVHVSGIVVDPPGQPHFIPEFQDEQSRARIKQAWWRQIINATFLKQYPKIKAVSFFEFFKFEETTWRDFTIFGGDGNLTSPDGNDGSALNGATLKALQSDMDGEMGLLVDWATPMEIQKPVDPVPEPKKSSALKGRRLLLAQILHLFLFITYLIF